jgi:hypothetical protein
VYKVCQPHRFMTKRFSFDTTDSSTSLGKLSLTTTQIYLSVPRTLHIMSINASAWVTLVLFFLSTTFVIHPLSFHVPLPFIGRTKITIGLMTAPVLAIAILWAAQCLGATHIRDGIVGTGMVSRQNSTLYIV